MSRELLATRRKLRVSGTDLIARHDAAAGREAADVARAGLAGQLLPILDAAMPEAVARVEERTPSVARYAVGMASPKVRTALRSGDLARWDLDRLCAVSASLGHRVEAILVPQGMRAIVAFEPA
ncbi:hypothetical protein FV226_05635 [Methylobacterium sp. WL12]|uniref:hypothetical protein n=1 Tax=Methylobacterium sp. WL12 TaxID=2603890 RepID=UPI0011C715D9|nr:hypothetical protein [Methylobacterium sp. WL12]TXM74853.1 hypothetical protein FV226_05635 [Methylobacterium sp. WL12]